LPKNVNTQIRPFLIVSNWASLNGLKKGYLYFYEKPGTLMNNPYDLKNIPSALFKFKFKFKLGKEDLHGGLCPIVNLSLKN
jgi:hypothetical protein